MGTGLTPKGAVAIGGEENQILAEDVDYQDPPSASDLPTLAYLLLHEYVADNGTGGYKWTAKGAAVTWLVCVDGEVPAVEDADLTEDVDYAADPNGEPVSALPSLAYLVLHGYVHEVEV